MCTLRLRGDSHNPTSASRTRRSALAPFRLSMLFLFRGGIFLKLNGRKRGSVGLLLRKKQSEEIQIQYLASCHFFSLVVRQAHGVHPRHPPRTFPLGLLAPRCLGLAHLLALPLCGAGARAPCCLGGGRNPPPSFGLLLAVVV